MLEVRIVGCSICFGPAGDCQFGLRTRLTVRLAAPPLRHGLPHPTRTRRTLMSTEAASSSCSLADCGGGGGGGEKKAVTRIGGNGNSSGCLLQLLVGRLHRQASERRGNRF